MKTFSKIGYLRRLHCPVVSLNLVYMSHEIDTVDVGREELQFPVGQRRRKPRMHYLGR